LAHYDIPGLFLLSIVTGQPQRLRARSELTKRVRRHRNRSAHRRPPTWRAAVAGWRWSASAWCLFPPLPSWR